MPSGLNGFRAWTDVKPLTGFRRCNCGWSGLPHYSQVPGYKCVGGWRDKLTELSEGALIWIWVHKIDHGPLPTSLEHQLVVAELMKRNIFEKAEAARA
jgi:hypothetical protein